MDSSDLLNLAFVATVYLLGVASGITLLGTYAMHRFRKYGKDRLKLTRDIAKSSVKSGSAKERINKAFDICEQQFAILAGMEGPQSGPMHGRHKQKMNEEIKRLEEEKMTILKSVLADGFDPKLVTINEAGEREAVKLSEFVKNREMMEQQKPSSEVPKAPQRKLSLIKKDKEGAT